MDHLQKTAHIRDPVDADPDHKDLQRVSVDDRLRIDYIHSDVLDIHLKRVLRLAKADKVAGNIGRDELEDSLCIRLDIHCLGTLHPDNAIRSFRCGHRNFQCSRRSTRIISHVFLHVRYSTHCRLGL